MSYNQRRNVMGLNRDHPFKLYRRSRYFSISTTTTSLEDYLKIRTYDYIIDLPLRAAVCSGCLRVIATASGMNNPGIYRMVENLATGPIKERTVLSILSSYFGRGPVAKSLQSREAFLALFQAQDYHNETALKLAIEMGVIPEPENPETIRTLALKDYPPSNKWLGFKTDTELDEANAAALTKAKNLAATAGATAAPVVHVPVTKPVDLATTFDNVSSETAMLVTPPWAENAEQAGAASLNEFDTRVIRTAVNLTSTTTNL